MIPGPQGAPFYGSPNLMAPGPQMMYPAGQPMPFPQQGGPVPMQGGMQMQGPVPGTMPGAVPGANGFPSPRGAGGAPMMMSGSQQGSQQGYPMSPGMGFGQPIYAQGMPQQSKFRS